MIKISLILPIYNVEKYLERCIKSILNQSYQNFEIVLVDDGSSDECSQICDKWKEKDNRIKVVHKKNEGLGKARNTGMEYITGDYVWFVDSDDFIVYNALEIINNYCRDNIDVILFGFSTIYKNGSKIDNIPVIKTNYYERNDIEEKILPNLIGTPSKEILNFHMSAWASVFKVEFLKKYKLQFVSEREIIAEDVYSLLNFYKYVNKMAIIDKALYNYCENESSLTHTYREDRFEKIKNFYNECIELCEKLKFSDIIKNRLIYPYFSFTLATMKMIVNNNHLKYKQKINYLKKIINDKHFQLQLKKINIKDEKVSKKILIILIKMRLKNMVYFLIKLKGR